MKKIWSVLLLSMFCLFLGTNNVMAGASIDQENDYVESATANLTLGTAFKAQSFRPALQHLTQVDIYLKNKVKGKWIDVYILDGDTNAEITSSGHRMGAENGWESFFFDQDLTKEKLYKIKVLVPNGDGDDVRWWGTINNYSRGMQFYGEYSSTEYIDMVFRTWGTDPVEIVEEQTNPGSDKTDDETGEITATSENVAPSATTSSSITKPTELKAEYSEGVKLSWKASTMTDIDGYIVFRSETKGKNYTKLDQTSKSTYQYTDKTALAGTTYYYIVRAYKGSAQSVNSNEASIAVPANAGPISPLNLKIDYYSDTQIRVTWDKNPETNILEYLVSIYQGDKLISTKTVKAENNSCLFQDLLPNTDYKISVIAKNSLEKSSQPSEISQKTTSTPIEEKFEILSALEWTLFSIASFLTLVLIVLFYKRHKKSKQVGRI